MAGQSWIPPRGDRRPDHVQPVHLAARHSLSWQSHGPCLDKDRGDDADNPLGASIPPFSQDSLGRDLFIVGDAQRQSIAELCSTPNYVALTVRSKYSSQIGDLNIELTGFPGRADSPNGTD